MTMKVALGNLTIDARFTGQYRSLLRRLGLLTLFLVVLITSTVVYFDERLVKDLSRKLIASTGNVAYILLRLALVLGMFNYGKKGILDLTHQRLFTVRSFSCSCVSRVTLFIPPM